MKIEDIRKLTKDLADEDLSALHDEIKSEVRNRKPKVSLDSIKPGMTPEARNAAMAAIQDVMKGL
jgi:hypothetical protein